MFMGPSGSSAVIRNIRAGCIVEQRVQKHVLEAEEAARLVKRGLSELIEGNRMRTVMVGSVAFDLRGPLGVVVHTLDLLADGDLGEMAPDVKEWVESALWSAREALRALDGMFVEGSRLPGNVDLRPERTDVGRFMRRIYDYALGQPFEAGVQLKLQLSPSFPVVMFDRMRVTQVLMNLLANSFRFTHQGEIELYARYEDGADEVVFGVSDSGVGIPAGRQGELFRRFHDVVVPPQVGGLGLVVCRELVELHGGRIWVESVEGKGSDFKFALPVRGKVSTQ